MKRIAIAIGALMLLCVGALAYASIPAPGGTINGCRKNTDGSIRVIDSTATCQSGWTALNWNQTGPAGPTGPAGVSGYEVVSQDVVLIRNADDFLYNPATGLQTRPVVVDCPTGKVPLSGGGKVTTTADVVGADYVDRPVMVLADSRPTATGWSLVWMATGPSFPGTNGTEYTAHIAVTCGNV